ncbi:MAG: hypothetical protein NWQ13_01345, partial [Glaciimonas sp.]|nr:hypothetical protein [Glaciimonas sp.]
MFGKMFQRRSACRRVDAIRHSTSAVLVMASLLSGMHAAAFEFNDVAQRAKALAEKASVKPAS